MADGSPRGAVSHGSESLSYDIHYGKDVVEIDLEGEVEVLNPADLEAGDESVLIKTALENPIDSVGFGEFATYDESLLIIVNDGTRPTPTARIVKEIYPVLKDHPNVKFLIATGAHRAPNQEEYDFMFGEHYEEFAGRIFAHDARDEQEMVHLGTSSNGTEMYINRMVPEAGRILVISSVEPHYFGGYTGGRKSFLPGVASYKTITQNHKLALSNRARALALDGNPVHEDMMDALKNLTDMKVFSIQTVLTGDHRIFAVTAGDLHGSFYAAIEEAFKIFCVPLNHRGNIVITVAPYPMDVDLYQSQKAVENGKYALQNGGVLTFFDLLSSEPTPQEVLFRINKDYKLGWHKAAKMAQIGVWAQVWAVTELPDDQLEAINITPYHDLQKAVDDAVARIREKGSEPRTVILPSGSLTVPVLVGTETEGGWMKVSTDVGIDDLLEVLDISIE